MADTGLIAIRGYKAGQIRYVITRGYVPTGVGSTLVACVVSRGFGIANTHKKVLRGFVPNPGGGGSGAFYIFGDSVVR